MDMDQPWRDQWRHMADVRAVSEVYARGMGTERCLAAMRLVRLARDEQGALLFVEYCVEDGRKTHTLRYSARQDDAACPCNRGQAHHACWHQGIVLMAGREWRRKLAR